MSFHPKQTKKESEFQDGYTLAPWVRAMKRNPRILSMKYWLFNRNPSTGYYNPITPACLYTLNNRFFFIAHMETMRLMYVGNLSVGIFLVSK